MTNLGSALWAETLKMFRSKVPLFTGLGFLIAPTVGGLFMVILKDPEAARSMGLISAKAQLTIGSADWESFFGFQLQAIAAGGMVLFSIVTTWIFGREFSDHTVKELLSLPTSREAIVTAKFIVVAVWSMVMTLLVFGTGIVVGTLVVIPGWSVELVSARFMDTIGTALLTIPLITLVALLASAGRGYMSAFGWIFLTMVLANIVAVVGWGDWFPWSVPGLFSGAAGPRVEQLGLHSYAVVILTSVIGLAATYYWWRNADQTK
jgi:ABC-2 type transport system permease protein